MNGPYFVQQYSDEVRDADGVVVGCGVDYSDEEYGAGKKAEMICAALNAVYYAKKASES